MGRSSERDRAQIRELLGFHPATIEDCDRLTQQLTAEVLPLEHKREHILEAALDWLRRNSIEDERGGSCLSDIGTQGEAVLSADVVRRSSHQMRELVP